MQNFKFRSWSGKEELTIDELRYELTHILKEAKENSEICKFYIGSDSYCKGKNAYFVTAIIIHRIGKGGRIWYTKSCRKKINSLQEKLLTETTCSTEVAFLLYDLAKLHNVEIVVHADVNGILKYESSAFVKEISGYITGQGLICKIKPESFAATTVADRIARRKKYRANVNIEDKK